MRIAGVDNKKQVDTIAWSGGRTNCRLMPRAVSHRILWSPGSNLSPGASKEAISFACSTPPHAPLRASRSLSYGRSLARRAGGDGGGMGGGVSGRARIRDVSKRELIVTRIVEARVWRARAHAVRFWQARGCIAWPLTTFSGSRDWVTGLWRDRRGVSSYDGTNIAINQ